MHEKNIRENGNKLRDGMESEWRQKKKHSEKKSEKNVLIYFRLVLSALSNAKLFFIINGDSALVLGKAANFQCVLCTLQMLHALYAVIVHHSLSHPSQLVGAFSMV